MGNPFLKRITITHVAANLTILFFAGLFLATGLKNRSSERNSGSSVKPVDYNVYFDKDRYKGAQLRLFQLGELIVPTGKIIVGGPFEIYDSDPLKRQINPGKYPVIACIVKTKNWGERYAAVKLEISKSRAVKWELAVTAAQDTKFLKRGKSSVLQ